MLVQALATSQPQGEATVREDLDRRSFLSDDGGWYLTVGHVTYVINPTRSVAWATAPSTDQA
ncbi:hypothetical protein GCM10020255_046130 [Rhodococcus baikonurensis]